MQFICNRSVREIRALPMNSFAVAQEGRLLYGRAWHVWGNVGAGRDDGAEGYR